MNTPFKMKGWSGFSPLKQKEDMDLVHGTSYMESKNPDPLVHNKRIGRQDRSSHLMAHSDEKMEAWPTLFQDDKGNWYEPPNSYAEAKRKGEIYKFDTIEETRNFAIKGNWKNK